MKDALKKLAQPLADWLFKRLTGRSAIEAAGLASGKAIRVKGERPAKSVSDRPIHLVFVCHMPALWGMFDTIHRAASADRDFETIVVALPCMHPNLAPGRYSDLGMYDYLKARGVKVIEGYDKERDAWLTPESLTPDYVLFQTPYNLFPQRWSAQHVSTFAKVCYVPYATTLFRGEVDEIVHPEPFFRAASLVFAENPVARHRLIERFKSCVWFREEAFVLSGSPKLDGIVAEEEPHATPWKRGPTSESKRILWTPRWWTNDGSCHFFDYGTYFSDFCARHDDVDFVFRPHPLSIQNFLNSGELTGADVELMELSYERSPNMAIDKGGDYQGAFLTSDVLVSDISSMMIEYLVTGKPIVYTHRIDLFNDLGRTLSEGFYWVRNSEELTATLEMLIAGNDPLREKRRELIKTLLFMPEGGAGWRIKETLKADFRRRGSISAG
jgi:hypothetical protein